MGYNNKNIVTFIFFVVNTGIVTLNMNHLLHVLCITVLLLFGVSVSKPKEIVANYDAEGVERIKRDWMKSPLGLKDYRILLNAIQSLQNDNNALRRNLLNEGEIGTDAAFKPRRLAASEENIFDGITEEEREQWIDIMSRIKWASLNAGDRRRLAGDGERTQYAPELIYKPTFTSEAGEFIFPDPSHPEFKQVIIEGTARKRGEMPDVIFDSDPSRDPDLADFISSCKSIEGEKPAELINAASKQLDSFKKTQKEWQPTAEPFINENEVMRIGEFIKNKVGGVGIINALYSVCLNSVPWFDGHFALQSVEVLSDGDIWQPYAVVLYDQEDGSDKFMFDEYTDLSRLHGVKWDDALKGCGVTKDCDIFEGLTSNVKSGESVRVRDVSYPNVKYFREDDRLF